MVGCDIWSGAYKAGYEAARLIDTPDGTFMGKKEASWLGLAGSTLLVGKK
jgi:hypothetical protein